MQPVRGTKANLKNAVIAVSSADGELLAPDRKGADPPRRSSASSVRFC